MNDKPFDSVLAEINDFGLPAHRRLTALSAYISAENEKFPSFVGENNNHIHTIYSFSPYTPSMAALLARRAGLNVAGSVDHDSIGAAREMREACRILGIGCVTGFELRASFRETPFSNIKLNNPDSVGIAYMTVQGVPEMSIDEADAFLRPIREARHERTRKMLDTLNMLTSSVGLSPMNYDRDVLSLTKSTEGGGVTARHLLYALAKMLISEFGKGPKLVDEVELKLGIALPEKVDKLLRDPENTHYEYDLLGVLKSGFLAKIFIQPNETECVPVREAVAFARRIGAIPAYAYLGDVGESSTGDKKTEAFEDSFLDDLFPVLKGIGYQAVAYMPPRNSLEQLLRVQKLCKKFGLMEISGVDINSSRQSFNCPEIRRKDFLHLIDSTYALVAHERLSANDLTKGLFSPESPYAAESLEARIARYAQAGRTGATLI